MDSRYISRYWAMLLMRAFLLNSFEGLKRRFSTRWDSMFWLMGSVGKGIGNKRDGRGSMRKAGANSNRISEFGLLD